MSDALDHDPIAPGLAQLLALFDAELAEVKFPELDRAVLHAQAELVRERAAALLRAQAALESARLALQEGQEALAQKGQRALAYARVFAEEDAALGAKLDAISLPRAGRRAATPAPAEASAAGEEQAPKRRGRPPKSSRPSAPLFEAPSAAPAATAYVDLEESEVAA